MMDEKKLIQQKDLEELEGLLEQSVIIPLLETMEQIRRSWQDPAGDDFLSALSSHRDRIGQYRKLLFIDAD